MDLMRSAVNRRVRAAASASVLLVPLLGAAGVVGGGPPSHSILDCDEAQRRRLQQHLLNGTEQAVARWMAWGDYQTLTPPKSPTPTPLPSPEHEPTLTLTLYP